MDPTAGFSGGGPYSPTMIVPAESHPSWFKPMSDVWVASAQPWDCLDPAIPKLPKGRPPRGGGRTEGE